MRQFIIAAAILSAANMSAWAQPGQNPGQKGQNYAGAPGPVLAVGLPTLVIGGGVYWLVKRRRRTG